MKHDYKNIRIPDIDAIFDALLRIIDDAQLRIYMEATVTEREHKEATNAEVKKRDGREHYRFPLRVDKKDENRIFRAEWSKSVKRKPPASDPEKTTQLIYVKRGRGRLVYPMKRFKQAKPWELDLIFNAEKRFGVLRLYAKILAEMKAKITTMPKAHEALAGQIKKEETEVARMNGQPVSATEVALEEEE